MQFLVLHDIFGQVFYLCYSNGVVHILKLGFSLFLKMFRLGKSRVCSGSSFLSSTTEGKQDVSINSRTDNSQVMFGYLKNYVMVLLMRCQEKQSQVKLDT